MTITKNILNAYFTSLDTLCFMSKTIDKNSKIVKTIIKRYLTTVLLTKSSNKLWYKFHDTYRKIIVIINRANGNIL